MNQMKYSFNSSIWMGMASQ